MSGTTDNKREELTAIVLNAINSGMRIDFSELSHDFATTLRRNVIESLGYRAIGGNYSGSTISLQKKVGKKGKERNVRPSSSHR